MGKNRDKMRRFFGRLSRGSGGRNSGSTNSLAPSGANNRPTSPLGCLESTSSPTPSQLDLIPSANLHGRPASALEHTVPSSTTPTDVTSPDTQQCTSSSHTKTAWESAIEKLKPDDRKEFDFDDRDKCNTIAKLLQAVHDKRQECEDKKWKYTKGNGEVVVLRDSADRLLTNLNKFARIGDFAVQNGPQTVSLAWGVFRFLLQVATGDTETMGYLLLDLEYISRILARCEIYERIYHQTEFTSAQTLINLLPDLYASMLTYLCRSKRYFRQNTTERCINGMATSYSTGFQPMMENVKNLENGVESAARTAADELQAAAVGRAKIMNSDLQNILQSLQQENENKFQKICEQLEETERLEILKWLSEVKYGEHHEFIRSSRKAGTGNWLFEKPDYRKWETSAASAIFWLHGIAGAGKTTLASLIIDTFKKTRPTSHALAYFYCKYGENERREPEFILRAIVQQLSIISPKGSLPKPVVSLYKDRKKDAFNCGRLRLDESQELILQLSKAFEQTIIVIDALDECNKETREQLVDVLKSLRSSAENLKIFVTSRNDGDILVQLENEPEVYIQPSDNSNDINLFVRAEVERCISQKKLLGGLVQDDLKREIIHTLINRADGMFLWVYLQIQHISREKSESAIRAALKRLPKGLEATYSVIWDRICSDTEANCRLAKRTLMWIICTQSPLTPRRLIEAVTIQPKQWAAKPNHDGITEMTLLDVCQNLLVIDTELGVFRSAHFSVTEFLQKKFTMTEAHTAVAEVCLTLLCLENHVESSLRARAEVLDNYLLSYYAMKYWAEHVRLSGDGSGILTDLKKDFLKPSAAFHTWFLAAFGIYDVFQLNGNPRCDDDCSICCGSQSNRDFRLGGGCFKVDDAKRQLTPFWVVCWYRFWDMFEYALSSNTDYSICNRRGQMPAHLIASHGDDVGFKLLLEKDGVDWMCKDDDGHTPLHYAAKEGHEKVVKMLLEHKSIDPDCKTEFGDTPLHYAVERSHEKVVQILLEHKSVNSNCKNKSSDTPLYSAVKNHREKMVQVLLEQESVDPYCKNESGDTPLHYAAENGYEKVVQVFIEQERVDTNCKNSYDDTPLHSAAWGGQEKVVQMLLQQENVDLDSKNNCGYTPLHAASFSGHEKVVQLFLEQKRVDLYPRGLSGNTPLHEAAQMGREKVIQVLLEQESVDRNCKNDYGYTPLYYASQMGHENAVQMLLRHDNVDVNSKDEDNNTPLHRAAVNGHTAVVKLLLEAPGVDLDSKNNRGETPIDIAGRGPVRFAAQNREAIVKMLQEAAAARSENARGDV